MQDLPTTTQEQKLTLPDIGDADAYMKKYAPKGMRPLNKAYVGVEANEQLKDPVLKLGGMDYTISVQKDMVEQARRNIEIGVRLPEGQKGNGKMVDFSWFQLVYQFRQKKDGTF